MLARFLRKMHACMELWKDFSGTIESELVDWCKDGMMWRASVLGFEPILVLLPFVVVCSNHVLHTELC